MGMFGKKESERVQVAGLTLHCEICKNDRFWAREAQLNTAVATFFNFDWANPRLTATCATGVGTSTGSYSLGSILNEP